MKDILVIFLILFYYDIAYSKKVCKPPIIKSHSEIDEKLKICNRGDKLLLYFDIKLRTEELIVKLCNLEHTIISKEEIKIVHKRNSGHTIICTYDPN